MVRYIFGGLLVIAIGVIIFLNTRPWTRGAWDAADMNRDGVLERNEMLVFGQGQPHRNGPRLMMHFDAADTSGDKIVDSGEIEIYGTNVGSKDPNDHLTPSGEPFVRN